MGHLGEARYVNRGQSKPQGVEGSKTEGRNSWTRGFLPPRSNEGNITIKGSAERDEKVDYEKRLGGKKVTRAWVAFRSPDQADSLKAWEGGGGEVVRVKVADSAKKVLRGGWGSKKHCLKMRYCSLSGKLQLKGKRDS